MEPTPAAHSGELKWLRVDDNDGGNDGDGNQADEGGSDDMMNRRMMVMMTATAMRVMMTIRAMNDGAGLVTTGGEIKIKKGMESI